MADRLHFSLRRQRFGVPLCEFFIILCARVKGLHIVRHLVIFHPLFVHHFLDVANIQLLCLQTLISIFCFSQLGVPLGVEEFEFVVELFDL
jgi:hypothetical protein